MNIFGKIISKVVNKVSGIMSQDIKSVPVGEKKISDEMKNIIRQAGAEGIVMLKNNAALPLKENEKVSVFGRVQKDYFYVGYGSGGDVNKPYCVNLIDGLKNNNINVNEKLLTIYENYIKKHPVEDGFWGFWPRCYDEMPLDDATVKEASEFSEKAIVIIGRSAGEDRENILENGSYYLTNTEIQMLDKVTAHFKKVIVLLNCGNIFDMAWLERYGDKISSILYVWQGGMESGNAVADVLTGSICPCGKLSDTIAKRYEDYPSSKDFGNKKFNNYTEDIYVGYRYFETFKKNAVLYPFGYGMSYTDFEIVNVNARTDLYKIYISFDIKNIGNTKGKETAQIYFSAPQGKLGKSAKSLLAFCKTKELEPNEQQYFEVAVNVSNMASYDDVGLTGYKSAYVMEKGDYNIFIGTDVRSCKTIFTYTINKTVKIKQRSEFADCAPKTEFLKLTPKADGSGNIKETYVKVKSSSVNRKECVLGNLPKSYDYTGDKGYTLLDVALGKCGIYDFTAQLSYEELEALCRGDYVMNSHLGTSGNAAVYGGVLKSLRDKGVVPITATDGPSGIRLNTYTALLPIGTLLACTWNVELVEKLYTLVGAQMKEKGSDVLLAPGMNIHRNPLCGRNFEYFSEDPLLTGKMASAVVSGVQSNGVSACPKHFACNNQETNRTHNDSRLTERAMREIYLRGFEICVKEARPQNIMTSYNKINGVWAHYHYGLCTQVLRDEWHYEGCVMTDWWMRRGTDPDFPKLYNNAYRIRAQVDVLMPGAGAGTRGRKYDPSAIKSLKSKDGLTRGELMRSAMNTLRFVMYSRPFCKENNLKFNYQKGTPVFEIN